MTRNVGRIDRSLRLLLALTLVGVGLFALGGLEGRWLGIGVALVSLMPFATSGSAHCPLFSWIHVHSLSREEVARYGDPYRREGESR